MCMYICMCTKAHAKRYGMRQDESNIIIYNTIDGKASVVLYARDGSVWMNQNQLAELFDTSVPNVCMHIANILKEGELQRDSVIKNYLTTATDGKKYEVTFYSLEMIMAIGFRVRRKAIAAVEADEVDQELFALENGAASDETDAELTSLEDAVQKRNKK